MVSREKKRLPLLLLITTGIVAIVLLVRIFWLIMVPSTPSVTYQNPQVATRVIRGTLLDSKKKVLAIETPYYSCAMLVREVEDISETASILASILSLSPQTIMQNASKRSIYYQVKRRLSDEEYQIIYSLLQEGKLKGVMLEKQYGRTYPHHYHGAQVIGFTNTENVGIEGIELAYDRLLSPYPTLGTNLTYGHDIHLTLDMDLQYLLDAQAVSIDSLHHPDSIMGIIMDAKTGAILAASSFPWYNPNNYQTSEPFQRQNKVITAMFEPGSVFKIFSLASELAADQANFSEPFYCDGSYTFIMKNGSPTTINCVTAHGTIAPQSMLKYSCNGAVAHWALQTDDALFRDTLLKLGFNSNWKTGMLGGISGNLRETSSWSGRTKATMAFGQELGVTALQLVTAATAIANNGNVMQPYIIDTIVDATGAVVHKTSPSVAQGSVLSPAVAHTVLSGMEQAVEAGGTATRTAVPGVRVAAKTGTAQIADPETGAYKTATFLASTLAIVPVDDPAYILYIGVSNPTGATIWGSNIAAPAIGSIIADMVRQGKLISDKMEYITLPSQSGPN